MYGSSSPSAAAAKLEQRDLDLVPTVRTDKPPDGHALCEEQIVWAKYPEERIVGQLVLVLGRHCRAL
jgi:hypothetical protein